MEEAGREDLGKIWDALDALDGVWTVKESFGWKPLFTLDKLKGEFEWDRMEQLLDMRRGCPEEERCSKCPLVTKCLQKKN